MPDSDRFVIKHKKLEKKEEATVTMTLRLDKDLQYEYDELANKSGRSRNEVMNLALQFALDHLEFIKEDE